MTDLSTDVDVSRCPSCQAELAQGAVLCVACGYHLEKKTRLGTEQVPPAKKKKKKKKKTKRYLWGILHGGNAIALCTLAGFMLAVTLALVLGTIFAAGNELFFELSIYVFFGALVGLGVGGGIGYILASILPHDRSEDVSDQLQSGLFKVIGGFVLIGIGLISFAIFNDMERGAAGPGRMFSIAILVYELLGKWGVLVVISGGGLALMVLGFRAMIPSKSE
ncbi:MAG TPA: hypothetical protein VLA12_14915 [Planctomycetaceae bacterium]|nr:hypothetical protein [Planctomycetaceae bacterium]